MKVKVREMKKENLQATNYEDIIKMLSKNISEAISLLKEENKRVLNNAIPIMQNTLDDNVEEVTAFDVEQFQCSGLYKGISNRLNLQALGYFIKEESTINDFKKTSFTQRDQEAEKKLQDSLENLLDDATVSSVYSEVMSYTLVKEEIQFSLGMKVGAKMAMLLMNDSEKDY